MACIYFKFKSDRKFDSVVFRGDSCTVSEFRHLVMVKRGMIKHRSDFDLVIKDAQTNEIYDSAKDVIRGNSSVIIIRTPSHGDQKPIVPDSEVRVSLSDKLSNAIQNPLTVKVQPISTIVNEKKRKNVRRDDFLCGVCCRLMVDAVMTSCCYGNFCAECVVEKCPVCEDGIAAVPVPNKALRFEIGMLEDEGGIDELNNLLKHSASATIPVLTSPRESSFNNNDLSRFTSEQSSSLLLQRNPQCLAPIARILDEHEFPIVNTLVSLFNSSIRQSQANKRIRTLNERKFKQNYRHSGRRAFRERV